jgi:hypothetical protein
LLSITARVVQRAQRARRQALDARRGLVEQEGFEDGVRLALVQVVAGHLDHARRVVEAFVDGRAAGRRWAEPLLDVQQQDLVELRDRLGGPVVALHQRLAGRAATAVAASVAEAGGHGGLQVEHQAVFAPVGHHVQARADQRSAGPRCA